MSRTGIYDVPNEILCQIFLYAAYRLPGEYSSIELQVSHVCARWRLVSIALPTLWDSICVLAHENPASDAVKSLTQLYLTRSGNAPLDLYVDVGDAQDLWNMLWPHAFRWRSVHFLSLRPNVLQPRNPALVPSLESLSLSWEPLDHVYKATEFTIWLSSPRLHTVSLDLALYNLNHFTLPWEQLLHLTIQNLDVDQMHQALRLCSNVVNATFRRCLNDFSYRDPVGYTSSSLSSLIIVAERRCETLGPDITHCVYPSLSALSIISGSEEFSFTHGIIPNLTALVMRSGCHLSQLTLHGISYSSKQLMELIQAVSPSLTKLDLCDVDHRGWNFVQLESWLIRALSWSRTPGIVGPLSTQSSNAIYVLPGHLLPHLKEFGIRFPGGGNRETGFDREKLGAMLNMVESRTTRTWLRNGSSPPARFCFGGVGTVLDTLHLGRLWTGRIPVEFEQRFRVLEDRGLHITAS